MLWRDEDTILPNNRASAQHRFNLLIKKFNKDHEYANLYQETMRGYLAEGLARKMSTEEATLTTQRTWYLPHHGVVNQNKPGKGRVVYDAAAQFGGHSLNGALMSGPDLLNNLFGVLQRFHRYEVALVTDIRAMYHQVRVPQEDADALRFLFKEDWKQPGPPDTYQMLAHIFGATDSPACALYALQRNAKDHAHYVSRKAVETVLHDTYMDDVVTSIPNVTDTISIAKEVEQLLIKGGFETHQWLSNNKEVMTALDNLDLVVQNVAFDTDDRRTQRTLGIRWDVQNETLFLCANPRTIL